MTVCSGVFESLQKGDAVRAEKLGRWAVAYDPGKAEAHRNLGLALAQQGKVVDALHHLVRGTREQATQILSGVLYQTGKLPEAMAVLDYASRWYVRADQWLTYGGIAYADVDAIDVSATARQLEVHTEPAAPTETTGSEEPQAPPAPAQTQTVAEAPVPQPQPQPAEIDRSGVYAAVPAGGTQPEEIERVVPRYPAMARRAGVYGSVVVRGIVRRDGTIDDVEIIKDLPYGLGEAAREAVSQWRFRPATQNGEPVSSRFSVAVTFRP